MAHLSVLPDLMQRPFTAIQRAGIKRPGDDPRVLHTTELEVGGLPSGMASGKPSVMFCIPLPSGEIVLAETSLALLLTAADALKAKYGDPR